MLDVHPPHLPTHTWKDFFIHVGTICVGLLIAIGLEQTVEAIHRQHERHLLQEELHAESELLRRNAEIDIDQYDAQLKWLLGLRKDVTLMLASHGKAQLPVREYTAPLNGHGVPGASTIVLLNPSWQSALADGRVALLPENLKRAYGIISWRKGVVDDYDSELKLATAKANAYAYQFADIQTPRTRPLSRMSEEQLVQYRELLTDVFECTRQVRRNTVSISGELNLVLMDQLPDQKSLAPLDGKMIAEAQSAHPEDFSKMAAELDAEDAARAKSTPALTSK
jgi:hypothetical protein